MSDRDGDTPAAVPPDEQFLGRWSRLKAQARERGAKPAATRDADSSHDSPAAPPPAAPAASSAPEGKPPHLELPDLEQLHQDSDYSAFLAPGVDATLRQRALRKLFQSPKFNVCDGLDTYRDDFRNFTPLGGIVTADMRHHLERIAQQAVRGADGAAPSPPPLAQAPAHPDDEPQECPAALPSARTENDSHDEPA
jgi:hypothetical protein